MDSANLVAARSGSQREALCVLRDSLAVALDEAPATVKPQIAAQYRACLKEIADLVVEAEVVSKHDELRNRREARRAAAAAVPVARKKGGKRGA